MTAPKSPPPEKRRSLPRSGTVVRAGVPSSEHTRIYEPAMRITEPKEAMRFLEELCVVLASEYGLSPENALATARSNLGYYAGYFPHEVRVRVERLFDAPHPLLGTALNGPISMEAAFAIGQLHGLRDQSAPGVEAAPSPPGPKKAKPH